MKAAPIRLRTWTARSTVIACLCFSAAPIQAKPVLLDFGTDSSPVRQGFTRITAGVEAGRSSAGWSGPGKNLRSKANPIRRKGTYSESSGRVIRPPAYLNELSCDYVEGTAAAELQIPVAPGRYEIWLLAGPPGGRREQVWDMSVSIAGTRRSTTYAGPWDCRVLRARVQAGSEGLAVRFTTRSRWALNAMAVVPADEWPDVQRRVIDPVEKEVFLLPPELLKDWKLEPRVPPDPTPEFSEEEQQEGFVLWQRPWPEPVWPTSRPKARRPPVVLKAFAAWDEYEPMTLTILPLRDGRLDGVAVSDFMDELGRRMPADAVDVRWVRYMMVRPNYRTTGIYYPAPDVLMPWRGPVPLKRLENLRLWFTVHVPPGLPGGVYRGTVRLTFDGGRRVEVPVLFRVLAFSLEKDRSLVFGQYYHHPYHRMFSAPDTFSREWWRRKAELEFADMAAHGNNTVVLGLSGRRMGDGAWRFDYDRLGVMIDLYRKVGFYQPVICHFPVGSLYYHYMKKPMGSHLRLVRMPPKAFFDELTGMVREIEKERRQRQWPELLYYPVDEPSTTDVAVRFMTAVMKAIKRVPGVRTYVTADPANDGFAPLRPYVDVWCCQPFSLSRETILADMKQRGVEYWCYPNHVAGENDHTPVAGARMTYGFGFWRSGFRALTPWIYQAVIGNPWNYLDGDAMDFFNRTADDASPIPVTLWEAYREGIDDGRYITTLERWIQRAREAGKNEVADAAEKDLRFVESCIPVMPKYKYDAGWDAETFDVLRWLLAHNILRIRAALGY